MKSADDGVRRGPAAAAADGPSPQSCSRNKESPQEGTLLQESLIGFTPLPWRSDEQRPFPLEPEGRSRASLGLLSWVLLPTPLLPFSPFCVSSHTLPLWSSAPGMPSHTLPSWLNLSPVRGSHTFSLCLNAVFFCFSTLGNSEKPIRDPIF